MKQNYRRIPMWLRYLVNFLLMAAFLGALVYIKEEKILTTYYTKLAMLMGINIILAVSLNIATGYLGQLPLGHAGFMAIGAYTSALLMKHWALPELIGFPAALLLAGVVTAIFGVFIGIPALRLRGDYLAIITLGFGEIIRVVLTNIDSVLGFKLTYGAASLKNIPKTSSIFNVYLAVILTCYVIHTVMKSRHGRAILSIRENEIAAEASGIHTTYYKVMGFALSAFFAGVAGGLYAGYIGILNPSTFTFMKSIEILVMVVLGGMGSMAGSVISASVLTIVPEALRAFEAYRMVLYALLLIVVMILKPSGLMGTYDFSLSHLLEKLLNIGKKQPKMEKIAKKEGSENG